MRSCGKRCCAHSLTSVAIGLVPLACGVGLIETEPALEEIPLDGLTDDEEALEQVALFAANEASTCSAAKIAALLAPATETRKSVLLDCSVYLDGSGYTITKTVIFNGAKSSRATLDCNGSVISPTMGGHAVVILSAQNGEEWSVPVGISVKNCAIHGHLRVSGMAANGQGPLLRDSSRSLGHTERAQAAAPTQILLDRLQFVTDDLSALYISPGVTYLRLQRSSFRGSSSSVVMYMDAESAHNTIYKNIFATYTDAREVLAVDGSAYNRIIGNSFSGLSHGGIYLYRNCGEGGTIRHQTPSHNHIINNYFYYDKYEGDNPAIWVASRNGNRSYCDADSGYPFGSSVSDLDHAAENVIAENQIQKRNADEMFRFDADEPNYDLLNETVRERIARPEGCFVDLPPVKSFVHSGDFFSIRHVDNPAIGDRHTCRRGVLTWSGTAPTQTLPFVCAREGDNDGCERQVSCPVGTKVVGARAGCNLETTNLSATTIAGLALDTLKVIIPSDHSGEGHCRIDAIDISTGAAGLTSMNRGLVGFIAACREHDENGGDCIIRGQALCL